ncbi:hypothetical protein HPP92_002741 [Vanilla planifolia]|uniref:BZIP domain-containing protein n=1 Tax=Vanilla planifolia TaxID=51239 RepID=A0A835RT38_VANPL|nr:hypothetical protein HPP92_002741 [Vanilla planifolia]
MDTESSKGQGGVGSGFLPDTSRFAPLGSGLSNFSMKSVGMASSSNQSSASGTSESGLGANVVSDIGRFSQDISRMPDLPPRSVGHRRAQSEILSLPDDITFDSDLGVVGGLDGPSLSDETEEDLFSMYLDLEKFDSSAETSGEVLQGVESSGISGAPAITQVSENLNSNPNEKPKFRHQHSYSMDGSTSIKSELLASGSEGPSTAETKKAISAAKLADLALVDPKRAKRIWANRQSAARSKERKMRYIAELERKVQTLQTEATTLSAQLTLLQRDTNGLNAENSELKLRLQTMEQQVHLQDALNDALREEVQRLKLATGQMVPNASSMMNFGSSFGSNQQFYHHNQAMQSLLAAQQFQQLQIHSQHQHQLLPQQQQTQLAELKLKGTMASQNQRDGMQDPKTSRNT